MKNEIMKLIIKTWIFAIMLISGMIILTLSVLLMTMVINDMKNSNKEYETFRNLSNEEKIEYNCTMDIDYFSGEENGWTIEQQRNCVRIMSQNLVEKL